VSSNLVADQTARGAADQRAGDVTGDRGARRGPTPAPTTVSRSWCDMPAQPAKVSTTNAQAINFFCLFIHLSLCRLPDENASGVWARPRR
jgi:hypothetical protein